MALQLGAGPRLVVVSLGLQAASLAAGCGFRTDPLFLEGDSEPVSGDETTSGDPILDPDRDGACAQPFVIPVEDTTITGTLPPGHGSLSSTSCSDGDGPEDVYVFVPTFDTDVTIRFAASGTDFPATLQVSQDGCAEEGFTLSCERKATDSSGLHFLARTGAVYFVTVESEDLAAAGGDYQFDVTLGPPPLGLCPVHPEVIVQQPGAAFLWGNEFSQSYGEVDGYCGGPGRENMFQLNATYPGNVFARVTGTGGFSPVVNLRTGCGATTELVCASDGSTGIPGVAELSWFVEPGTYYLVVDQAVPSSGVYDLRVDFQ